MSVPEVNNLIFWGLLVMNLTGFVAFGLDKLSAKKGWSRASEACLLAIAVFFGSLGCLAGMYLFRHKTQKKKFTITIPILFVAQLALLLILQMGL